MSKNKLIHIYTDGACSGNPGPGGWGVLMRYGEIEKTLSGAEKETTNNRMELMAAIMGLKALNQSCAVVVTTDSVYVQKGITEWLGKWKLNRWRTSNNKPVKNQDLWQQLDEQAQRHQVQWDWVKGHSGHPENEQADTLAREAIEQLLYSKENK